MRECNDYEITASKLLKVVHRTTERIKIRVVSDAAMIVDRQHEFYLTAQSWCYVEVSENG